MLFWNILPGTCVLCRRATKRPLDLCQACETDLPRNHGACPRCARPSPVRGTDCPACVVDPPPYTSAVVPFRYAAPMTQLIGGLKHGNGLLQARILATLVTPALAHAAAPDMIVPVPLTYRRRVRRGYNQAALLAARIGRNLGIPVDYRSVRRVLHTAPQQSLDAAARRRNVRGAYRASTELAGCDVAIIDDVMTTGATFIEVATTILDAGAATVRVWAIAHTPLI